MCCLQGIYGTQTFNGKEWVLSSIHSLLKDAQDQIMAYLADASVTDDQVRVVQQQSDGTWVPYTP